MKTLAILHSEGFTAPITEDDAGVVRFTADADIDADGANGQRGERAAYRVDNKGSEHLANGGMGIRGGRAVFTTSWGPDIAVTGPDGNPLVTPDGIIVTKTAYRYPGFDDSDPAAWVDSETVPYVVVPPAIVRGVKGVVKGCLAYATYKGVRISAVVADVGPRTKCGEISIQLARQLGIPPSPRTGGIDDPNVDYEIHPGVPAVVNGETFVLQPS